MRDNLSIASACFWPELEFEDKSQALIHHVISCECVIWGYRNA